MLKSVHFLATLVAVTCLIQAPTAFGQLNIIWTGATDTDWSDGSNWNAGVPGSLDTAFIIDGAVTPATISSVVPTVAGVHIGQGGASSTSADFEGDGDVDQDDLGFWVLDYGNNDFSDADGDGDSDGTDFLIWQRQLSGVAGGTADGQVDIVAGGDLTSTGFIALGVDSGNDGTLNVSGGSLTTENIFSGNSSDTAPSVGTANFSGGTVTASGTIFVGAGNNTAGSSVTQSGTSTVTADNVHVGETSTASYTLSGGTLTVNNSLTAEFSGLSVGHAAGGSTFIHTGGTIEHQASHLAVGLFAQGTYSMPAGSTGVLNINNGGLLLVGNEDATGGGSLFDQDGGTVNANTNVTIGRGGGLPATYDISGGALNTPSVTVGTSTASSGSSFIQSGGTVTTPTMTLGAGDVPTGGNGSYALSGGTLEMGTGSIIQVGGGVGAGGSSLSISGGTLNVEHINPGAFAQGAMSVSGTADVNLSGTMQVAATATAGNSTLTQSGGTLDVAGAVHIGVGNSGTYTHSGGTATIDQLFVGGGDVGTLNLTGGAINVPNALLQIAALYVGNAATATGVVNHSAGTLTNNGNLSLGHFGKGTYNLSASGQLDVIGGSLIVALGGTGADDSAFNQSGGTANIAGDLTMGRLGRADVTISGGTTTVGGNIRVAATDGGGGTGSDGSTYTQTGGTVTVTGRLQVGDNIDPGLNLSGIATISGGTLNFGDQIQLRNGSTLTIVGDAATIADSIAGGNGMSHRDGTLEFDFGANGVSMIDISGSELTRRSDLFTTATAIEVDGTSYTGGNGTFPLIDYAALGGNDFGFGSESVFGFGSLTATLVENLVDGRVDLVISGAPLSAVPEPTGLALVTMAGVLGCLRRRR